MEPVNRLMDAVNLRYNWALTLKSEQSDILMHVLEKRHVLGVLPTGFGKSLLYLLPPLMLDEKFPGTKHVALVVSPLRTLMCDQLRRCQSMGIKAAVLCPHDEMTDETRKDVEDGLMSVVFTSPEALKSGFWLQKLKAYKERICILAFDELHCISEWGNDFRPEYCNVIGVRSVFSQATLIGLSGTVTEKVLRDVKVKLNLADEDFVLKSMLPNRPNIYIDIVQQTSYDMLQDLRWLIDSIHTTQRCQPKTIIFAQTLRDVADIYELFMTQLGDRAYENGERNPRLRLVSMYHGQISSSLQAYTLDEFSKENSVIRVLICTVAFGMGVEIHDIREVVQWGKCSSILTFWQQVGRCGRDGKPSRAVWYPKSAGVSGNVVDKELFAHLKKDTVSCIRLSILQAFILPGMDTTMLQDFSARQPCDSVTHCLPTCACSLCTCCSNCRKRCHCS